MLSQSATYDEAIRDFNWFKYTGQRGKEVSERTHKRMIRDGDIFGIKSLKSGSRFTLIFPDMPHINFPLDRKNGNLILDKATKLRKLPDIAQREGRAKARGVKTTERQLQRKNFDAARFAPSKIPNEYKNGIEFSNYQWRIVPELTLTITHTKGREVLKKNAMIGMRYLRDAKGGVVINEKGMYLKLSPENYDKLVTETLVMPIQDWPNGSITDEDVKAYRADAKKAKHVSQVEAREAARLEKRAEKLAQEMTLRETKRAAKENARAEQERFDDMKEKIKRGEMEAPKAKAYDPEEQAIPTVRLRSQIKSILAEEELLDEEEEDLDAQIAMEEMDEDSKFDDIFDRLSDILVSRPFASDNVGIDSVVGSLFGEGDDSADIEKGDFDLSDVEEDEDDEEEEETPKPSKVRAKKVKEAAPEEDEDTESEEDSEEEDPDAEEDEEDPEAEDGEEEEEDPDAEEEEDSEDEEDPEAEEDSEEEDDTESEEDEEDPEAEDGEEEEEEDPEAEDGEEDDSSDAVEENDSSEEDDEDVLNAEQEAAKIAKKKAEENKGTPEKLADPEPGDVVVFKADEKLKRKWLVLKESAHKSSDSIIIYTLFDITNSPDEVRQVRINKARKQSLFDIAEHVEDMKPALFSRVYDMAEGFDVNKEPIVS